MVLLVVDVQDLIVTPDLYHYDLFVNNVRQLIHSARKSNVEIIYIRHDDGTELTRGEDGFEMIVPADCNTTVSNEYLSGEQSYRYYNEKMWNRWYAKCVSFEDALSMFQTAGSGLNSDM